MLPLRSLRVVEVAGTVSTRYCGHLLAALGADVTIVGSTDDRAIGFGGNAGVTYGHWLDRGKRRTPVDHELTGPVDLVVVGGDNSIPEWADAAIVTRIRWFHPDGPYSDWPATDEIVAALVGLAYSFGEPGGPPLLPQGHAPQLLAGANACNAALAALLQPPDRRPRTVEVDVLESAMCLSEVAAVAAVADPRAQSMRLGVNRFAPTYPCSSYRAADGWVGVTCLTAAQWRAMCALCDRAELADERRYSTAFRRLLRGDDVDAVLAPAIRRRTVAEWVDLGVAHRVPITAMPRPAEVVDHPHWQQRHQFLPVDGNPALLAPALPFTLRFDGVTAPATPLSEVRIVDFSMGWAGPLATRTLADLGADVVKVESATRPDWYRGWDGDAGGDPPAIELAPHFNALNRNKRGVELDLTSPAGRRAAEALIAGADIVIESFAAGVLDNLGLGIAAQQGLRPGIITVSMPAFGADGPLSAIRAYGSTVEQASTLPYVNGLAHWPPALQHVAFGDPVAGTFAATAVLAGLWARSHLGGTVVDLAQVACLFHLAADAIVAEQLTGRPLPRTGNRRPRLHWSGVVPAAGDDEWVAVAVPSDEDWRSLAGVVGPLPGDPDAAEDQVAAWASKHPAGDAAALLRTAGLPACRVQRAHELSHDPHLAATDYWQQLDRRHVGRHTLGAPPFRFDGDRPAPRRQAPLLGQHNAELLTYDDPTTVE